MEYYLNLFSGRQFVDSNGAPYIGAKLFIYSAGSSTKVTTYKDNAGASQHANPIILNARGEPADGAGASQPIWQEAGVDVKLVLAPANDTDPPVSAISTWDNIGGINDSSVFTDQWILGPTPTYVGTTSFTLVGDQSSTFHIGRRVKTTNSGGTIYSTISDVAYTTLTTVTVVNDSGVLDSGLSSVSYSIITATGTTVPGVKLSGSDYTHIGSITMSGKSIWTAEGAAVASANDCNIWTTDGNTVHVTGTTTIADWGTAPQAGAWKWVIFDDALQLTYHATTNKLNTNAANYTTVAGDRALVYADDTGTFVVTIFPLDGKPLTDTLTVQTQEFTASGTFTIPTPDTVVHYGIMGGGGGGGMILVAGSAGGGGGSGAVATGTLSGGYAGTSVTVTIGDGGAGRTGSTGDGTTGGTTTLVVGGVTIASASGGAGGGSVHPGSGGAGGSSYFPAGYSGNTGDAGETDGNDEGGDGAMSKLNYIQYGEAVSKTDGGNGNNASGDNATIPGSGGGGGVGTGVGGNGAAGLAYFWWHVNL